MICRRRAARLSGIFLASFLCTAAMAHAHVEIAPREGGPGEFAKLFFRVFHGCDGAPTVRVTVKFPDDLVLARPQIKPGWTISTKTVKYAQPIQVEGRMFTEGFSEVTWSGSSIPGEYMDDFAIAGRLPNTPGKTLRFLVQQECAGKPEPLDFSPELRIGSGGSNSGLLRFVPAVALAALLLSLAALVLALRRRRA